MNRSNQVPLLNRILIVLPVIALGLVGGTFAARYLELDSQNDSYDVESAAQVTTRNRTDDMIAAQQARLKRNPNDGQAYTNLAVAFLQKMRETGDPSYYTKADGLLHRALELNPNDFSAISALGSLALARHQFREALDWGERARALNPANAHNYGVIGDAQMELGLYAEAVQSFQTMVNRRPDLSSYARISYARELHGDLEGAIQAMRQAVEAGGPNAENTNWTRVQLGHLYFEQGQYAAAEKEYQAALNDFPDYPYALAGLGTLAAARRDYATAISYYTRVVNTLPLPQFVIALGDIYASAGQPDQAAQQYALVQVEEKLYAANGVDQDAEMALFNADHHRDLPEALQRARAAYARRPSITVADTLAWTLYQTGNYDEAQQMMMQALRLGTRNALMHYHAGMIAYQLGQREPAITFLDQALRLNPRFSLLYADHAQKLLSELRQGQ
ncbi:MAG: tetratricopeptide repeat protein [Chloroflexi bacterium]|nr:tetratricopeptide repeat protein [Chloroflexota bacterium]